MLYLVQNPFFIAYNGLDKRTVVIARNWRSCYVKKAIFNFRSSRSDPTCWAFLILWFYAADLKSCQLRRLVVLQVPSSIIFDSRWRLLLMLSWFSSVVHYLLLLFIVIIFSRDYVYHSPLFLCGLVKIH